ncbi:glycosyltransferase family 87 protein [Herpetosiphon sp. NSE202]|uniref:glycosyltransferase family 87 protein n=1 Tax=Herpetosiphon sp. NSE202 TaxID=3351349 RepID=UPI003630BE13
MNKLFTSPYLRRFIQPALIITAIVSFIQFTITYGIIVGLEKQTLDFPSFYWASDVLFNHNISPYDVDYIQKYTGLAVFPFAYAPPSIIFFYPFSLLNYDSALILHLIMNHIFIIIFILLLNKIFRYKILSHQSLLLIIMIYNSYPMMQNVYFGQINIFIIVFLLLFVICEHDYPVLSSIMLSFAIIIKLYPIIILLILLISKKYKIFINTIISIVTISIISAITIPKFVWKDWILDIVPNGGYGKSPKGFSDPSYSYNKSFNGLFSRIFTKQQDAYQLMDYPLLAKIFTYSICILLCGITFFVVYKYLNDNQAIKKIVLTTMPLLFMIAPVSWNLHLITLYPTIIYLFDTYYHKFMKKINIGFILIILTIFAFSSQSDLDISLFFVFMLWVMMLEVLIETTRSKHDLNVILET